MMSAFLGFVVMVLAEPSLKGREAGILAIGFLVGGLIFSWLLGAFDVKYGWLAAIGHSLGIAAVSYLVFRRESDRG
jgi:hypothetical protein